MIPILFVAALPAPCPLCTPDGRMAMLAKAQAKSFDALEAPGRSLIRVMVSGPGDAAPVITFVREADGSARIEAADGRTLAARIDAAVFSEAQRTADAVRPGEDGPPCGPLDYSVQRREGLGAMSAVEGRACNGVVRRAAETLAALAAANLPLCKDSAGADAFDRLARCLRR
jgi:hypothetical protein